jgi:hypothetical protein
MKTTPVTTPLKIGPPPMMDANLRHQMMQEVSEEIEGQLKVSLRDPDPDDDERTGK